MEWEEIETAPKDGTIILVAYRPHPKLEGERRVFEARWNDISECFTSVNGFLQFKGVECWAPLPKAPEF